MKRNGNEWTNMEMQELIGKGSYGEIYKGVKGNGECYAVKILHGDEEQSLEAIEKEINILLSCDHPNIVKCYSVQVVRDCVWIVMDFCLHGSLADIMHRRKRAFTETEIRFILKQILTALAYLHEKRILHRDIKAANILVDGSGGVKVADFGVSTLLNHTKMGNNTRTGSPFWMSPELLSNSSYSFQTDIWSLGITAIELAEGAPPYSHQHPYRAIFSIQSNPPQSLSCPQSWSQEFNNFVKKCLTIDDKLRPSAKQLLSHPFIHSCLQESLVFQSSINTFEKSITDQQIGTVILHQQKPNSLWEKSELFNSPQFGEVSSGTFCIKQNIDKVMDEELLKNITQAQESKLEPASAPQREIQNLYKQMQQQIISVREKYLKKIRKVEERSFPSFHHCFEKGIFQNTFKSSLESNKSKCIDSGKGSYYRI